MPSRSVPIGFASVALGLALAAAPARAAAEDAAPRSPLHAGAWSLDFGITQNFTLDSFDGALISIKHHTSDRSAWRAGVSVGADFSRQTATFQPDTTLVQTTGQDRDYYTVALVMQLMRYLTPSHPISMYYALGPSVGYGKNKVTYTNTANAEGGTNSTSWDVGLAGGLGAEWSPSPHFGLHAEYLLSAGYSRTKGENATSQSGTTLETVTKLWRVRGDGVRFGLSAYF